MIAGTDLTLRLFDFDSLDPFSRALGIELFLKASVDANIRHLRPNEPIGLDLIYTAKSEVPGSEQSVLLTFSPKPLMTWSLWSFVINGLVHFTYEYEDVGLHFIVIQRGQGKIGEGHIINLPGSTTDSE